MQDPVASITERLYDGITEPQDWYAALDGMRQATEGGVFHHVAWNHRTQCVVSSLANDAQPADKVREYEQHLAPQDPRIPIVMAMPVGGVLLDHEHFSPQAMSRSAIYADWLVPLGYRHTLGVPVYDDGTLREWVCVIRQADQRPFGDETNLLLRRLMPDLLRASRLRVRMADLAEQAAFGTAALDLLPQALVLVDALGLLRYANPAASRMLADDQGWRLRHGRVCANSPDAQEQLARGIAAACRRHASGRAHAAPVASTFRDPQNPAAATLHILPLHPAHPLARNHWERPHALLVWGGGRPSRRAPEIAAVLGLTETEARLALALAQGLSVKDFARTQGCTWHTARTHARNLLLKTGLHRQADIAVLVYSLIRV